MNRTIAIFTALIALCFATWAFAGPADEINRAIAELGYDWVAADNQVARLHNELGWYAPGPAESIDFSAEFAPYIPISSTKDLPVAFDWRDIDGENYVPSPKNQLSCGSCWAFATTGPVEIAIAYAEGWVDPHFDLSEQQLVSCSSAGTCASGGLTTGSFKFAQQTGLVPEKCFKYTGTDHTTCGEICPEWHDEVYKIDDWQLVSIAGFSVDDIKEAILQAPVAASLVIYEDFYNYSSGVYENTKWIPQGLHAVTLIGWEDANSCWIAKNSWGGSWGEKGFFKIKWGNSLIGSASILPTYTSQGLGPEPDDDDDNDAGTDDPTDDDDDDASDQEPEPDSGDDDDDDDGGCCG